MAWLTSPEIGAATSPTRFSPSSVWIVIGCRFADNTVLGRINSDTKYSLVLSNDE
jgi:hypothetical protein